MQGGRDAGKDIFHDHDDEPPDQASLDEFADSLIVVPPDHCDVPDSNNVDLLPPPANFSSESTTIQDVGLINSMQTLENPEPQVNNVVHRHPPHIPENLNSQSQPTVPEKFKAENFPAKRLAIGSYTKEAKHEADLVAKIYFSKKKLVWEILDGTLKNKLEMSWSDIIGWRASIMEKTPGILEIELDKPPAFFREHNPQPRKHTNWRRSSDFTRGEASLHRRHYIAFHPGVMDKHYEKLLRCDERLLQLSQRVYPSLSNPYFDTPASEVNRMNGGGVNTNPNSQQVFAAQQPMLPSPQTQYAVTTSQSLGFNDSTPSNSDLEYMIPASIVSRMNAVRVNTNPNSQQVFAAQQPILPSPQTQYAVTSSPSLGFNNSTPSNSDLQYIQASIVSGMNGGRVNTNPNSQQVFAAQQPMLPSPQTQYGVTSSPFFGFNGWTPSNSDFYTLASIVSKMNGGGDVMYPSLQQVFENQRPMLPSPQTQYTDTASSSLGFNHSTPSNYDFGDPASNFYGMDGGDGNTNPYYSQQQLTELPPLPSALQILEDASTTSYTSFGLNGQILDHSLVSPAVEGMTMPRPEGRRHGLVENTWNACVRNDQWCEAQLHAGGGRENHFPVDGSYISNTNGSQMITNADSSDLLLRTTQDHSTPHSVMIYTPDAPPPSHWSPPRLVSQEEMEANEVDRQRSQYQYPPPENLQEFRGRKF